MLAMTMCFVHVVPLFLADSSQSSKMAKLKHLIFTEVLSGWLHVPFIPPLSLPACLFCWTDFNTLCVYIWPPSVDHEWSEGKGFSYLDSQILFGAYEIFSKHVFNKCIDCQHSGLVKIMQLFYEKLVSNDIFKSFIKVYLTYLTYRGTWVA